MKTPGDSFPWGFFALGFHRLRLLTQAFIDPSSKGLP